MPGAEMLPGFFFGGAMLDLQSVEEAPDDDAAVIVVVTLHGDTVSISAEGDEDDIRAALEAALECMDCGTDVTRH